MKNVLSIFLISLLLAGCRNLEQHYDLVSFNVNPNNTNFKVAVQDRRPYVLNGDKADTFVGIARTGIGTPLDVNTTSGKPFAEDVSKSIKFAFESRGARVDTYVLPVNLDEKAALSAATDSNQKTLLLVFHEWKSDRYRHMAMHYDFNAYVVDRTGKVLAVKKIQGSSHDDPEIAPKRGIVKSPQGFFAYKMEEVFSTPEIVNNL